MKGSRPSWFMIGLLSIVAASSAQGGGSAESFFDYAGIDAVLVSPNGRWIAASAHRGADSTVLIQQVGGGELLSLARSKGIGDVAWDAPDTLMYESLSVSGIPRTNVAYLTESDGKIVARSENIPVKAGLGLVDALPTVPGQVLWEFEREGWTSLHRISLDELIHIEDHIQFSPKSVEIADKLAIVNGPASHWIVDQKGNPRAALRYDKNGTTLMMPARGTGPLESVYRWGDDERGRLVEPVGLTANGSRLIVEAYAGKDTRGLYEFDAKSGKVDRPIFVHADFDVRDVLRDRLTGDLVAAVYDEDGDARFHYFDEYRDRFISKLPEEWRRDSVQILNGTLDRQTFVFFESSATDPGTFYVRDRRGGVHQIGQRGQNIDRETLSPVTTFKVGSSDGVEVEAYLTLPRDRTGPAPLIVMPHGGPFGARDYRQYDPFVQYLASWGFAVLQMNFRGSEGYGLEFAAKVKKAWARGIEDDIDAAVEHAMALESVDEGHVCIVGMSYGGFSSLASVIRHRDRYRCAVSIFGVTDVPLMAESSDFSDSKRSLAHWKGLVGDPAKERDKMLEISPAYHADAIDVPVLIIQGLNDRRVDPDHAHRMAMMLELYGKEVEMLELEGAGHGFDRDGSIIMARAVRRFISPRLRPDAPFEVDPRPDVDR